VILRVAVMTLPAGAGKQAELCRQLLEYNARDLVHGAYGLEGDRVVLVDTLELENLDFAAFEASFDSLTLALATHLGALTPYRE
jgi:CesT_Tir_1